MDTRPHDSGNAIDHRPAGRLGRPAVFAAAMLLGTCLGVGLVVLFRYQGQDGNAEAAVSQLNLKDIPFNGARAYDYLKKVCQIGPRRSGSPGMIQQQKLLAAHFKRLGGQVEYQRFRVPHPLDGTPVPLVNLIVHWHPESKERILLCAHYDTLPVPLRDPVNPQGTFIGANDNGSGVALLMELAHDIPKETKYGIDFVFLDGEEFIFNEQGRYFLGSEYFARDYVKNPPGYRYRWGVLLDMVGYKSLQICQEANSAGWEDTRGLVESIWDLAQRLGVREFVAEKKEVRDDHLPLHNTGKIPCIDIIAIDYPAWHTQNDTADQCSPLALAKVGWVLREWLKEAK
jgi:glutaminyl-peptide cyclotransferase